MLLEYANKDGRLISVNDVDSGLKCGCTCPSCGESLIARKGNVRIFHFAHQGDSACKYAVESSLHLLSKEIISEAKTFYLPKRRIQLIEHGNHFDLEDSKEIVVDRVEIEQYDRNVKPDLIIYSGDKKYHIEIYVTHKADEAKIEKLKKDNVYSIEIDLSNLGDDISREQLKQVLLEDNDLKYWLNNPESNAYKEEKLKNAHMIKLVHHGLATHTEYCPNHVRDYKGSSFANITDCFYCDEFCGEHYDCTSIMCAKANEVVEENKKQPFPPICSKCGAEMRLRKVVKQFSTIYMWGCSNYPNCQNMIHAYCPECGGNLRIVNWQGDSFIGCKNYPDCKFTFNIWRSR